MTPNVIDIYHGNVVHDFAAIKAAGIVGVIHKCTQGAGSADPLYSIRRQQATDAGLLWGAYSFNTGERVDAQVKQFLSHAEPDANTLVCLDFEDNPASNMSIAQADQWVSEVASQLGRRPVLYSGNRVKDLLGSHIDLNLGGCRLWLAQYGPRAILQPSWHKYWLWQYSEHGRLPGTDGLVDLNYYAGTTEQLKAEWAT